MEIHRGRPEVTAADHPTTIYKALTHSRGLWKQERPDEDVDWWWHRAQNAYETLRDAFGFIHPDQEELWRPDGKVVLWDLGVDQLEFALVGYGVNLIEDSPEKYKAEIDSVNNVLRAIDKALNRKKMPAAPDNRS